MQTILQNANPPGPADQNMPVNASGSSQIHTPGNDLPGSPSGQGGLDLVTIGSGYGFVAEKGTAAEGGPLQKIDITLSIAGGLHVKNPC